MWFKRTAEEDSVFSVDTEVSCPVSRCVSLCVLRWGIVWKKIVPTWPGMLIILGSRVVSSGERHRSLKKIFRYSNDPRQVRLSSVVFQGSQTSPHLSIVSHMGLSIGLKANKKALNWWCEQLVQPPCSLVYFDTWMHDTQIQIHEQKPRLLPLIWSARGELCPPWTDIRPTLVSITVGALRCLHMWVGICSALTIIV